LHNNNLTLAIVPLGTGVAEEISALFTNVITWNKDETYDAILFEGGSDIHPSIYNDKNIATSAGKDLSKRDNVEVEAMKDAIDKGALIIGICRGAQLACALAGGKLVQDVSNHHGTHNVTTIDGNNFNVSSVHHQQMYPWTVDHDLLAWTPKHFSDNYIGDELDESKHEVEPEAVFFPTINALAFQWHPEWYASQGEIDFTITKIKERLYANN
jgi:putative glutamine amidotransferase